MLPLHGFSMQRYEIQALENGMWSVIDHQTGDPLVDREGTTEKTRLEAQAWADFRNDLLAPPAKERLSSRLKKMHRGIDRTVEDLLKSLGRQVRG